MNVKKSMSVVNVKKSYLAKNNIGSFEEWAERSDSVYIGRNMSFYVKGATKSKWSNPFTVKKYGLDECLVEYEKYVRETTLYKELPELQGKTLGCWCKPNPCHGDILVKLLDEYNMDKKN